MTESSLDKAIKEKLTLKELQPATLRALIRRLDDHDVTNHSNANHSGLIEASRVVYDLIREIEESS